MQDMGQRCPGRWFHQGTCAEILGHVVSRLCACLAWKQLCTDLAYTLLLLPPPLTLLLQHGLVSRSLRNPSPIAKKTCERLGSATLPAFAEGGALVPRRGPSVRPPPASPGRPGPPTRDEEVGGRPDTLLLTAIAPHMCCPASLRAGPPTPCACPTRPPLHPPMAGHSKLQMPPRRR